MLHIGSRAFAVALILSLVAFSAGAIPLEVRETAGIARTGEVVQSGVPLTRELGIMDVSSLSVTDALGNPVPAQFQVLSRWDGGPNEPSSPIQWVLVMFPASVGANKTATYHLVTGGGSHPSPAAQLAVTRSGNDVVVATGEATFVIGGNSLFKEIRAKDGTVLVRGGDMTVAFEGQTGTANSVREVQVRRQGPLSAIVTVTGTYPLKFGDPGPVSYLRRYEFRAGSPTAIVRHVVTWEGSFNGNSWWASGKTPTGYNLIEGSRIRDTLDLSFTPSDALIVGSRGSTVARPFTGTELALRTLLRHEQGGVGARWQPRRYEITGGTVLESGSRDGHAQTGTVADGGMLAARGNAGTVAVAIDHMHKYEPQALRVLPSGDLAIDIADDRFRLALRQGVFATIAVSALPPSATRADLDRLVWAPLNHPLRALAPAAWYSQSRANIDPFPAGPLPAQYASYDKKMKATLDHTLKRQEQEGLHGLMTTGLWPRYWGNRWSTPSKPGGEIGNGDWSAVYMSSTWTDYYSTTHTAGVWALRSGETQYLDELVKPAALRTIHTQIIQGGPDDTNFYTGMGVAGYSGYRSDLNTKHHYWDNIFLYYYLTGDESVVDTIERGSGRMMQRHKSGHWGVTGAVSALWMISFRFLGHTVEDPAKAEEFREHFLESSRKMITDHYAELTYGGSTYGFLYHELETPGQFVSDSPWTLMGYDIYNLHWLMVLTDDAPVGPEQIRPSRVIKNVAKAQAELYTAPDLRKPDGALLGGNRTVRGNWARGARVHFSGPRVGGTVTGIQWASQGGQWYQFSGDKPYMAAAFAQAAALGADPSVQAMSEELLRYSLDIWGNEMVLGKIGGLGIERVHEAIAVKMAGASDCFDECGKGSSSCTQDGRVQRCGNYDADRCLEWGNATACAAGSACADGACTPLPWCGDGTCSGAENCGSCAADCGACAPVCGDGVCNGAEDCGTCSGDCGVCANGNIVEAEMMGLTGYLAETHKAPFPYTGVRLSGRTGTATAKFTGAAGAYDLTIIYVAEDDGTPTMRLLINGAPAGSMKYAPAPSGWALRQHTFEAVPLKPGDTVTLEGTVQGGAFARIDRVEFDMRGKGPAAPGLLRAERLSASSVRLTWSDNAADEERFQVLHSISGAPFTPAGEAPADASAITITGIDGSKQHTFRVRAANAHGASDAVEVTLS